MDPAPRHAPVSVSESVDVSASARRAILAVALLALGLAAAGCGQPPHPRPPAANEEAPATPESGAPPPRRAGPRIPIVRIGIAPEVASASVRSDGPWRVGVVGGHAGIEEVPAGASWVFEATGDRLRVHDHRGNDRGGGPDTLFLFPAAADGPPLKLEDRPFRGEFLVFAAGGGRLTVVDVVDLESYLRGVLPAEIGSGGDNGIEAVKAQAVAARSYTLAYLDRWHDRGFDLLAGVGDQVYLGMKGEKAATDRALRETCGVVALYDGAPIEAYYSSTCGGMTSTPEEAWGRPPRPYLKVHRDCLHEGDAAFCAGTPQHRWTETWDGPKLEKILRASLPAVTGAKNPDGWGRLRDIRITKKSASLRVEEMEIEFEKKTFKVGGDPVRMILRRASGDPLRSDLLLKIRVRTRKGRVAQVAIDGAGFGHGVGLCQMGALGMARAGYDYEKIIRFYYPGVRLARAYRTWPG